MTECSVFFEQGLCFIIWVVLAELIDCRRGCIIKSDSVDKVIRDGANSEIKFFNFDIFKCNIFRVNYIDKGVKWY